MTVSPPLVPDGSDSARTRLVRRIAADPTSTALLLAAPSAVELWPGVRRVGEVAGRTLVETDMGVARVTAASVTASPPRRTLTAYVTRFGWTGPGLPSTSATLTLTYAPAGVGVVSTHAALQLDSTGLASSDVDERALRSLAEGFLDNLSRAAEQRADAA